jgi:hypothetical protein
MYVPAAAVQVLPGVLSSFRPQLVLYDAGVDIHADDELGRLSVSDQGEGVLLLPDLTHVTPGLRQLMSSGVGSQCIHGHHLFGRGCHSVTAVPMFGALHDDGMHIEVG